MSTAAIRVLAFVDLWALRRSLSGQYGDIVYSLGIADESVDLSEADIREALTGAWDEGYTRGFYAAQALPSDADASEGAGDNPYEGHS